MKQVEKKKERIEMRHAPCYLFVLSSNRELLLRCTAVAAHELVHTTSRVDELSLTSKEGVRRAGDFHLDQGIFYSVDDDGFLSGHR